jgi:hypothetical protein
MVDVRDDREVAYVLGVHGCSDVRRLQGRRGDG